MSFKYTQEWADELLHLYVLEDPDGDDEERIMELIEIAEGSDDVRVARVLIECLCQGIDGIDETVKSTLNTMSFKIYYEALFSSVRTYIKEWGKELGAYFSVRLDDWYARKLTQEELELVVFPLAKKYLTKEDIKNAIKVMEECNVLNDSPNDQFYAFFNKELNSNWTPPPEEEVELISEEEMQKNREEIKKMFAEMGIDIKF